jgi:SAM-dependent methyltransferase
MVEAAQLEPGQRILEIGAGLGKFSLPLLQRGLQLTCLDLSPVMLARLRAVIEDAGLSVDTVACDAADAASHVEPGFDRAIGFFMLHHLHDLAAIFSGLRAVLRPGAQLAFIEPTARNPLYYAQITLTPRMSWRAERGILKMRRSVVHAAMESAGLLPGAHEGYGFFPPVIANLPGGTSVEQVLDRVPGLRLAHAFQVFRATVPA